MYDVLPVVVGVCEKKKICGPFFERREGEGW